MGSDVEKIKERLDIAEIIGGYVKLAKAGQSLKGRCPFHSEKTPSFFVSPARQSYYCFGCGAKGDIFTFVEQTEGLEFKEALKILADKAGVELQRYSPQSSVERSEKEKILEVLEVTESFFKEELEKNSEAKKYFKSRGISEESIKIWNLGYAPAEWRALYSHLLALGYKEEILFKAGLIKPVEKKSPYDTFRDRLIFPLRDSSGNVIAFSGRALSKETEPKYLNSPDSIVFKKHEVLYGLDKAKDKIRRKDYAVLVEGQIDLVMSHQAGVDNAIASSGTAFTQHHLGRLKKLSKRIILAFDGDKAGASAAEKSAELALSLGLEVKVAKLPLNNDPADLAKADPAKWKNILREAKPAIEHFLDLAIEGEKDRRKLGKIIEKKILSLLVLLESSIERSHFVSLIAKKTGIKEEVIWEDLKKVKRSDLKYDSQRSDLGAERVKKISRADEYHEVIELLKENPEDKDLRKHKEELSTLMRIDELDEEIALLRLNMVEGDEKMLKKISALQRERDEEKRKAVV
ncbi:MAG: DNA primase [Candidatus Zambryskibacteria bacterium RIFCSPLOWO2_01_FULL_47_14]|uniref:DNA primase n=1 Tax=Candidatus Zambryskibacteria bacterium RIFCSPLOWO2_01_FULL_47_14 TaxID=1802763 RepID=A0A1G2U978_9BACT|nr:MAG: DNA primase [Candidatus Zambryskibacteria bacterium RIFCSPLOWO2_01_FULL_47_14]